MIDIKSCICSMKIKWLKKSVNSWKKVIATSVVYDIFYVKTVFNMGKIYCEYVSKSIRNEFWIDVLKAYLTFMERVHCNDWYKVLHIPLFYNEHFLINSKHICLLYGIYRSQNETSNSEDKHESIINALKSELTISQNTTEDLEKR